MDVLFGQTLAIVRVQSRWLDFGGYVLGRFLSPRFKITASARSFDVALEGRSTGTGGSYGFDTSR